MKRILREYLYQVINKGCCIPRLSITKPHLLQGSTRNHVAAKENRHEDKLWPLKGTVSGIREDQTPYADPYLW